MIVGLGTAIIEIRGIDLLSKSIASAAGSYVRDTQRMVAQSEKLENQTRQVTARITALNDKMAANMAQTTTKISATMAASGRAIESYQIKIGSTRAAQAREINNLTTLYNKVPAAQQAALAAVENYSRRIANREAKIAAAVTPQQRGGLLSAQARDTAAIQAQIQAVTSLTAAEQNRFVALARGIALKKNDIAIAQQQIALITANAKAETTGIATSSAALQKKLALQKQALEQSLAQLTANKEALLSEIALRQNEERRLQRQQALSITASRFSSMGLMGTALVTAPLVMAGSNIAKAAKDFDAAMRNIQSISKQTDASLKQLADSFIGMSTDICKTLATPNQLA